MLLFFDGRDPEVDSGPTLVPHREQRILEYLVRNRRRRLTGFQHIDVIFGVYSDGLEESVVVGHVSKLLTQRLGYDPVEAKHHVSYVDVGSVPADWQNAFALGARLSKPVAPISVMTRQA